jgi:hypothetical protein
MEHVEIPCKYVNNVGISNKIVSNCNIIKECQQFDRVKALEESKRLLELLNSPLINAQHHESGSSSTGTKSNINLATCTFCKTLMPLNTNISCKYCNEVFCRRHRGEINHNCEKLSKDTAKYLNAKNQFKLKLREVRNKAVR